MNRKALILFLTVLAVACFVVSSVNAQAPSTMTYQGKLTDGDGNAVVGTKQIIFSIYTVASGGSAVWTETINVEANDNGVFTAVLGQTTPLGVAVFDGDPAYLGLRVVGEASEMTPRQLLTSTAYAISAEYSENIPNNSVTSVKIVNGAVRAPVEDLNWARRRDQHQDRQRGRHQQPVGDQCRDRCQNT